MSQEDSGNPYEDTHPEGRWVRVFKEGVEDRELVWHRDVQDRVVTVLKSERWAYQLDDSLPIVMTAGDTFTIPKMVWHRIIRGSGDLEIEIFTGRQT